MAFWNRDKAPVQKHSIIEVIRYDGPNDILIWKFPNEDFNTKTQLIVGPAQEAIFVKGGQVVGSFPSGTYTLDTKNYPFIRSLVGLVTGGVSPFSCTVYYVNKVVSMGIDWGTDTPISVVDPIYRVPVDVRSYGDFSLRVEDGENLMKKMVGQTNGFSHQEIEKFFTNLMATQIRGVISGTMLEKQLSTIGIDAHLSDMSVVAMEKLRPIFEPYGIAINHFSIAAITTPQLDMLKKKALELQEHRMVTDMDAEDKRKRAQAQAFENRELNVTEQQKWAAQMGQTVAENSRPVPGVAGIGFAGVVNGGNAQSTASSAVDIARMLMGQQDLQPEPAPAAAQPAKESFEERARKAKFLYENGMITFEQYQDKIDQLMSDI